MFEYEVPANGLDLGLCVSSGQVFRWREHDAPKVYIGADGDNWYRVDASDSDLLRVTSNAGKASFERLFRLDIDAGAVKAAILGRGPELGAYMDLLPGLRLLRPSDPVEAFICFLCTPNNNVARISKMVAHLASFGPMLESSFGLQRFPEALVVASIPEAELRARGFGYRSATIPRAARALVERGGRDWLDNLKGGAYAEAFEELQSIPGIGPKLADCIALFALHHTLATPVDTHLWQAVVRVYHPEWNGKSLTDGRYRQIGEFMRERFGEYAGWAHQYLFYENLLNWRAR
jgi:N-glycosylase/DNA lyase